MQAHPAQTESIQTHTRSEMVNITDLVAQAVRRQGISEGFAIVFIPHTTAGITINENADPDVRHDLLRKLEELVPLDEPYYQHAEDNSDAHVKASLVGSSVTVLVSGGRLALGTWQGVYLCEFDGPRRRQMIVRGFGAA